MPSLPHHRALANTLAEAGEWMAHAGQQDKEHNYSDKLAAWVAADKHAGNAGYLNLQWLGHYYRVASVDAYARGDLEDLARLLTWAIEARALFLRWEAAYEAMRPNDAHNRPTEFRDALAALGPLMLGRMDLGDVCGRCYVLMVQKDQRLRPTEYRRIQNGTIDPFTAEAVCAAYGLTTSYEPVTPIATPFRELLDTWHLPGDAFGRAMAQAADFHILRSRASTDEVAYEFEEYFDRVFPPEILSLRMLRQQRGLPDVTAQHALADAPWAVLESLPAAPPNPLLTSTEAFLRRHLPDFR